MKKLSVDDLEMCSLCGAVIVGKQRLWHEAQHDQNRYEFDELKDTTRNHRTLLEILREEVYRD